MSARSQSPVILYMDYFSQPSRAVLSFCLIANIPHEVREIRIMRGDHLSEEFSRINPIKTIPTIVHNNITICESHAILAYLATVFHAEDHWYPSDPAQRAYVDQYLHWHHQNIRFGCGYYVFFRIYGIKLKVVKSSVDIDEMILERQKKALAFVNETLSAFPFIAKTYSPTIADLSCYCEFSQMEILNFDFSEYPNIINWMRVIGEIQGVKEAHRVWNKFLPRMKM
ncbi:unnamed protein product [Blepharisma stoltei]|uniref:Glutathione S-transferase n=1 Tax=Blepharisma stoltei TaxID=1481888 RepID=A0AAU9I7Z6_9CILI|nr:unnamed protein product [Blepharisma stoltei]